MGILIRVLGTVCKLSGNAKTCTWGWGTYTPRISVQVGRGWELGDAGEDIGKVLEQRSETMDVGVVGGAGGQQALNQVTESVGKDEVNTTHS